MIRHNRKAMFGGSLTGFLLFVALCAFGYFLIFYKGDSGAEKNATVPTTTVAVAKTSGATQAVATPVVATPNTAKAGTPTNAGDVAVAATAGVVGGAVVAAAAPGLLAGGWLLAEGLGLGMMLLLSLPFFLIFCGVGVLSDWGDPHFNWRKREQDPEAESREFATTILFTAMMLTLNWAGVPIWDTLKSIWGANWWYAIAIIPYIGAGIWWCSHRWNDLTQYLNDRRKRRYVATCDSIRGKLESILSLEEAIGKCRAGSDRQQALVGKRQDVLIDVRMNLLGEELSRKAGIQHGRLDPHDVYEAPKEFEASQLERWITDLTPAEGVMKYDYPPEFKSLFEESAEDKKRWSTAWQDHRGQLYLWIAFWPMSMTIRVIHKIITLELLKTFFMAIVNRLGRLWDSIAKRNEIEISAIVRDPTPPNVPADEGEAENRVLTIVRKSGTEN